MDNDDRLENVEKNIQKLIAQVGAIESMLANGILKTQERQDRRLDRHSDRLDELEKTQHQALTLKSLLVWMTSVVLTALGIVVAVAQLVLR